MPPCSLTIFNRHQLWGQFLGLELKTKQKAPTLIRHSHEGGAWETAHCSINYVITAVMSVTEELGGGPRRAGAGPPGAWCRML